MAALKKAAGAGLAIILSASMITLPAAQAHPIKTPIPIEDLCAEPAPPVGDPCPPCPPCPEPEKLSLIHISEPTRPY